MNAVLRDRYLSIQRFNRYLHATEYQEERAKKLYAANMRLAQAFHPALSQFEVILRNTLNLILSNHFSDPDWIINQKFGFMNDPSLASSNYFLKESILRTERHLRFQRIPVTAGKIISGQMFSFWLAFFIPHHYSLVRGQPIYAFPNKPSTEGRVSLHQKLEKIKNYRNRMNHCEPLCFNGSLIDCNEATAVHSLLYDLIKWIDPNLVPYFNSIDKVPLATDLIHRI